MTGIVLMGGLLVGVLAQTLTESIGILLLRDGQMVSEHVSWEACQVESKRLAQADPRTSGSVTYTCQTETRRMIATYTPPVVDAVPTIYVDHDDPACSNDAPGTDPALPICDLQVAGNPTLVTGKTTAALSHVKIAASLRPYRLVGNLTETTPGTTWQGTGPTPGAVMLSPTVPAAAFGIAATPGRANVCQFDPGTLVLALHEVGRPTDLSRPYPPAFNHTVNKEEHGVYPYYAWHARGDQPNLVNTAGATVTLTQGRAFTTGAAWVGKAIEVADVATTIVAVTSSTQLVTAVALGTQTGVGALIRAAHPGMITDSWKRDTVGITAVNGTAVTLGGTGTVSGGTNPFTYPPGRTLRDVAGADFTIRAFDAFNALTLDRPGAARGTATIETFDTPCAPRTADCGPPTTADLLAVVERSEASWVQDMHTLRVFFHPPEHRACAAIDALEVATSRVATAVSFAQDGTTLRNLAIWGQSGGNPSEGLLLGGEPLRFGGNGSLLEQVWTFGHLALPDFTFVPDGSDARLTLQDNIFGSGLGQAVAAAGKSVSNYIIRRNLMHGREAGGFSYNGPSGLDPSRRVLIDRNIVRDSTGYKRRSLSHPFDWWADRYYCASDAACLNGNLTTHVIAYGGPIHNVLSTANIVLSNSDAWVVSNCTGDCVWLNNVSVGGFDLSGPGGANAPGSIQLHNNVGDSQTDGVRGARTGPLKCRLDACAEIAAGGSSHNVWFTPTLGMVASRIAGFSGSYSLAQLQARGIDTKSQAYLWNAPEHLGAFMDRRIQTGTQTGGDDYRPKDAASVLAVSGNLAQCAWITTTTCSVGAYQWLQHGTTGPWNAAITPSWLLYDTLWPPK